MTMLSKKSIHITSDLVMHYKPGLWTGADACWGRQSAAVLEFEVGGLS